MGVVGTEFNWILAVILFLGDLFIYISITHLFRSFSLKYEWQKLSAGKLLIRLLPAILFLGLSFMLLTIGKNYFTRAWFNLYNPETFKITFNNQAIPSFITGIRLMSIWVLAYYGYHFAQREIKAVRENARLSIIAKDAEFNNLSAQLNPHFFFNSLNSIKGLVLEDPTKARRAIDLLSDLMRTSLYGRGANLISVKDEMELIKDYLELEKMRFEKRLQTKIEIDDNILSKLILPFSIQVLVENAIKHGIAERKEGGEICIKIKENNGFLQATIRNPGKLTTSPIKGLGLKNLRERLHLQFSEKASFDIIQQQDTVLATLIVPLS